MHSATDAVFEEAGKYLQRERRRLEVLQQASRDLGPYDSDGFAAVGRALSYIIMGGVLENLMRDLPVAMASDLVILRVSRHKLPVGVLAVLDGALFRKTGDNTVAALMARADLLRVVTRHSTDARLVEDFSDLFRLADGSTISTKNFEALWAILDLPGSWKNIPEDAMLVREISTKRNDVAHWLQDPVEVGRSKRPTGLIEMVDQLIDLLDHVQLHLSYWIETNAS